MTDTPVAPAAPSTRLLRLATAARRAFEVAAQPRAENQKLLPLIGVALVDHWLKTSPLLASMEPPAGYGPVAPQAAAQNAREYRELQSKLVGGTATPEDRQSLNWFESAPAMSQLAQLVEREANGEPLAPLEQLQLDTIRSIVTPQTAVPQPEATLPEPGGDWLFDHLQKLEANEDVAEQQAIDLAIEQQRQADARAAQKAQDRKNSVKSDAVKQQQKAQAIKRQSKNETTRKTRDAKVAQASANARAAQDPHFTAPADAASGAPAPVPASKFDPAQQRIIDNIGALGALNASQLATEASGIASDPANVTIAQMVNAGI